MKRIYLILGEGAVGKSSLLRCLTGMRVQSRKMIRLTAGGDINLWAWMRSAQEAGNSPTFIANDITMPSETPFTDYLVPLRISLHNQQPGYLEYVNALRSSGCTIIHVAVVTRDAVLPALTLPVAPLHIPNSMDQPVNANAVIVRRAWGWQ